ncbi:hypothetical protein T265_00785 [Opisthorchis viverrini]|uniref:Uncharacterized protein n=1 Tax=Opisthorchis viverrini TaxID=6198 RepID=A0A075AJF3_OPIVI|nr:hypothetical protein T265_00785 [Opisthorchis viverrini]KER33284.1 hypothetical protein T265_00785 [Opisthorchis viverrini]
MEYRKTKRMESAKSKANDEKISSDHLTHFLHKPIPIDTSRTQNTADITQNKSRIRHSSYIAKYCDSNTCIRYVRRPCNRTPHSTSRNKPSHSLGQCYNPRNNVAGRNITAKSKANDEKISSDHLTHFLHKPIPIDTSRTQNTADITQNKSRIRHSSYIAKYCDSNTCIRYVRRPCNRTPHSTSRNKPSHSLGQCYNPRNNVAGRNITAKSKANDEKISSDHLTHFLHKPIPIDTSRTQNTADITQNKSRIRHSSYIAKYCDSNTCIRYVRRPCNRTPHSTSRNKPSHSLGQCYNPRNNVAGRNITAKSKANDEKISSDHLTHFLHKPIPIDTSRTQNTADITQNKSRIRHSSYIAKYCDSNTCIRYVRRPCNRTPHSTSRNKPSHSLGQCYNPRNNVAGRNITAKSKANDEKISSDHLTHFLHKPIPIDTSRTQNTADITQNKSRIRHSSYIAKYCDSNTCIRYVRRPCNRTPHSTSRNKPSHSLGQCYNPRNNVAGRNITAKSKANDEKISSDHLTHFLHKPIPIDTSRTQNTADITQNKSRIRHSSYIAKYCDSNTCIRYVRRPCNRTPHSTSRNKPSHSLGQCYNPRNNVAGRNITAKSKANDEKISSDHLTHFLHKPIPIDTSRTQNTADITQNKSRIRHSSYIAKYCDSNTCIRYVRRPCNRTPHSTSRNKPSHSLGQCYNPRNNVAGRNITAKSKANDEKISSDHLTHFLHKPIPIDTSRTQNTADITQNKSRIRHSSYIAKYCDSNTCNIEGVFFLT